MMGETQAKLQVPSVLRSAQLSEQESLWHGFTTRDLASDYDRISVELNVLRSQIYYLNQVHSNLAVLIERQTELDDLPCADALITNRKDIIIGVRTADCLPILVFDQRKHVVAAIHAGYKGLLNGVVQNTFRFLSEVFSSSPQDCLVALGPAICVNHYEMGQEVIDLYKKNFPNSFCYKVQNNSFHLDLKGTAKIFLENLGVPLKQVSDVGLCTFEETDHFFSYRKKQDVGRQFNFIGMMS